MRLNSLADGEEVGVPAMETVTRDGNRRIVDWLGRTSGLEELGIDCDCVGVQ
jgi:hypothetical protein